MAATARSNSKSKSVGDSVPSSIVTRNMVKFSEPTGNVYESLNIIGKRARQISSAMKDELNSKLADFASTVDNLEEVFENREQIEISKYYEKLPKPTLVAIEEFLEGKVYFRHPEPEAEATTTTVPKK